SPNSRASARTAATPESLGHDDGQLAEELDEPRDIGTGDPPAALGDDQQVGDLEQPEWRDKGGPPRDRREHGARVGAGLALEAPGLRHGTIEHEPAHRRPLATRFRSERPRSVRPRPNA